MLEQAIYAVPDPTRVRGLVAEHPWATLVSHHPAGPVVSHAPVLVDSADGDVAVVGHLASADADLHELGRHQIVLIVQGPHGYVTPAWYQGAPYVPTWNFVVVHLHGRPVLLPPEQTYEVLDRTVDRFEAERPEPFQLATVSSYARRAAPYTTGFRLVPDRVVAKAKLSQDKPEPDRAGVLHGLETDPVHGDPALAAAMRDLGAPR